MNIREFSQNLSKLYEEMSDSFSAYQGKTGWSCPPGCGRCCMRDQVDASPFEMIPMALKIYDEGQLDVWLTRLESFDSNRCPLLMPGAIEGQGKCEEYENRPSICRMFGVAGQFNKKREAVLAICKHLREEYEITDTTPPSSLGESPKASDWSYKMASLDPKLIQDMMPIPQALKLALEKISFYAQYQNL